MPRSWAMEWKTGKGTQRFTAHRNRSDIDDFMKDYNNRVSESEALKKVGNPFMFNSDPTIYQQLCNVWGIFWNGRPGTD